MSNKENHSISFGVVTYDGQNVTAIVTMDGDDNVIDVSAKDSNGNLMELSKKDRDTLQNYGMLMVNSARKKIHEKQNQATN